MKNLLQFTLLILIANFMQAQDPMYDICPIKNSEKVPSAIIVDSEGYEHDIQEYIGQRPVVVVFYRGGWCPYCTKHLAALGEIKTQIDSLGFELIAITPDQFSKLEISKEKADGLEYKLFSDYEIKAINAFGIGWKVDEELYKKYKESYNLDLEDWSGSEHHTLPTPSVFIINKGVIQFQHVNPKYSDRLSTDILLSYLKAIKL